jgi:hypothetical protein
MAQIEPTQTALPKEINVMRVVSYDVEQIVQEMIAWQPESEPTLKDVMEFIEDWVIEDFGSDNYVTYQDENGNQIEE